MSSPSLLLSLALLYRLPDGLTRRGDINLLMLGDPGTAKSQLLKFVERCSPIGVSVLHIASLALKNIKICTASLHQKEIAIQCIRTTQLNSQEYNLWIYEKGIQTDL